MWRYNTSRSNLHILYCGKTLFNYKSWHPLKTNYLYNTLENKRRFVIIDMSSFLLTVCYRKLLMPYFVIFFTITILKNFGLNLHNSNCLKPSYICVQYRNR